MKKVVVAGIVVAFLGLTASPAVALRDPFQPAVEPDTGVQTGGSSETVGETQLQPATGGSETLANTGSRTGDWVVVALGLIATGVAAIGLVRLNARPITVASRR